MTSFAFPKGMSNAQKEKYFQENDPMMRGGRTAQAQQLRLETPEEIEERRLNPPPQLSLAEQQRMAAEARQMMDQLRNFRAQQPPSPPPPPPQQPTRRGGFFGRGSATPAPQPITSQDYENYLNSSPLYQEARNLSSSLGGKQPSQEQIAQFGRLNAQIQKDPKRMQMEKYLNEQNRLTLPPQQGNGLSSLSPKQLQDLLQGTPAPTPGKAPISTNLPKMSGPLGRVASPQPPQQAPQQAPRRGGIFGGRGTPAPAPVPAKSGLGSILAGEGRSMANRNPGINTTTTADMTRKSNAKPFSSVAGSLGMGLAKKMGMKKGGAVKTKKMASGGKVSSASKRGDGCAIRGKTKGKLT
jgi:hypothetical protein